MKKIALLILLLITMLTFTACGSPVSSNNEPNSNYNLEEITESSKLNEDLLNQFENLAKQRGYTIVELDDKKILFIGLGEKNTGGFDLNLTKISEVNDNIVITIEEIEPTDMVAQVISYPYKLYWLKGDIADIEKVKVVTDSGEEFTYLNMQEMVNTVEGKYIGQIDSHSIEVEVDGQPIAFQILEIISEFEELELQEGDLIEFIYIEKDTDERSMTSINKK